MPEAEKKIEEKEEAPEQLAIEIEDDNQPEVASEPEEKTETPEEKEEKRFDDYGENVQRRINKITGKLRESERREQAATEYARAVQLELDQVRQKTQNLDQSFVNEFDNRVQTQEQLLKSELKKAIDVGDSEKQAEIQFQLSTVAADKDKVNRVRRQQAAPPPVAQQPQPYAQPQPQPQPYAQPQQPVNQTDPVAQKWAEEREWFGEDRPMTLLALAEHESLLSEGFDPATDSEGYYSELNNRIETAFPHKFQKGKKRKTPKVAGASRARVNKNGKKEIVLTESEAKMAEKLNVPLKAYAVQLEKLRQRSD
jgi:hypothetical protein